MNDVDLEAILKPRVMTMRIIVFALLSGLLMFAGIAMYVRATEQMAPPPDPPMVTYLALILAGPMILAALLVPRLIEAASLKRLAQQGESGNVEPLLALFQQRLIIRSALFEGPAFFALVAYFIEGQWAMLITAGVMAFGIATGFPSIPRLQAWLDDRGERLAWGHTAM